jgi:CO/xanthine dehydrogenase Mo-binding subunit
VGEQLRVVGESVTRVDAHDKVTGKARYSVDLEWPDTLHGAVVRSQRAHALIERIDVEAALRRPGVRAVVTADDLEGLFAAFGHHRPDHAILAPGRVRYWGEPVAVVIADTRAQAQDARDDVVVDYEELEALMDAESAMRPGVPLIHPDKPETGAKFGPAKAGRQDTNEAFTAELAWGDVDAALASAPYTVTTTSAYPMLYAYAMEPYSAQARFVEGGLEVVAGAQHPFQVQRDLARVFDLDLNRVRVTSPLIGGGYGSKSYTKIEPLAAVCSRAVGGRPVKIVLDVEESMYTTRSDSAVVEVTTAFDREGQILARDITIVLDTGAYADNSPQVLVRSTTRCFGPYRIPALRVKAKGVYTNTSPASSYRGFGSFQTTIVSEANMSRAALELGIDPLDLRLRNVVGRGEELIPGMRPMDADLAEDMRLLRDMLVADPKPGKLHGVGFACSAADAGANPTSTAIVRLLADGSAILLCGSAEMGQGSRTVLAQIVAEELGIELDRVKVTQSDTLATPFQWTTGASRTTTIVGLSVQRACQDLQRQVLDLAADLAGQPRGSWQWVDDAAQSDDGVRRTPDEVIREWFGGGPWGELIGTGRTQRRGDIDPLPAFWEIGMVGVAVDIDPETGQVEVDQLVTLADVGRAINPAAIEGQDLGALTQGVGGALFEELVYEGPQIVNANMVEYRVPRMGDLARRIDTRIVERGDGIGPYGAKGVGEGPMTVAGGAVFAAVADATGRWPDRAPLTPERVWHLLQQPEEPRPELPPHV